MKTCSKCKQEKPTKEFYNDKKRKDGLTPYCKPCHCSYKTVEGNKKATATYHQRKKLEDPVMFMWKRAKHRAQYDYKGMEFSISKEDIILPEICPYFGKPFIPLDNRWGYSLDRIDSSKGYVPGNIEVISRLANTMKNNATAEELVLFAEGIIRRNQKVGQAVLVKVDAAQLQLEWRTLVELSRDAIALQEILDGEDTHTKNQLLFGLPSRLIAKVYLFRTIYRGSGWSFANDPDFMHVSTSPQFWDNIGEKFYSKYEGIDNQHNQWKDLVIANKPITIPSGREWLIEMARDKRSGELKIPWTVLTNYPNQGLGADVMMLVRLSLWKRIRDSGRKVKFISTVHDDIKFDTPEENVQWLVDTCHSVFADLKENIHRCWGGYNWVVPMPCEVFQGMDMLNMNEVKPSNDLTYLRQA